MKRILTAVALTALAASPALAQYGWRSPAMQSYAAAPTYAAEPSGMVYADPATGSPYVGPHTVISQGRIVGADPDVDIRNELRRNPQGQVQ